MPYKDKEKQRAYDKARKRKKRFEEKEAEVKEQIERGNINYALGDPKAPKFMSFQEYRKLFPNKTFKLYLAEKIRFEKENRMRSVPKISEDESIKVTGVDVWHGSDTRKEDVERHHREADKLEEILNQPQHSSIPQEHTDWKQEIDDFLEQYYKEHPEDRKKKDQPSEDDSEQQD